MKKKIFSVLLSIFLVMAGVLFSACGNKYQNLEFDIFYAYTEDADEWFNAKDGIVLNYGGEDDLFSINPETQQGSVYLRVSIKNVKAKYIDEIIVSCQSATNLNFTDKHVRQNEVFEVSISGNLQTTLNFYETNSGKKTSVSLSVYRSLTEIRANEQNVPILRDDAELNLYNLNNLSFYPIGQTNQTGVEYEVLSLGRYNSAGTYMPTYSSLSEITSRVTCSEGKLAFANNFVPNDNCYVIRVRAVSTFKENLYADFSVYAFNTQSGYSPKLTYANQADAEIRNKTIDLYFSDIYNGTAGRGNYSSALLNADLTEFNSVYKTAKNIYGGSLQYVLAVAIDNETHYFDGDLISVNGLVVTKEGENYKLSIEENKLTTNNVKFFLTLKLTNKDGSYEYIKADDNKYVTQLTVNKKHLINNILLNGQNSAVNAFVYSTTSAGYKGYELRLETDPTNPDVNANNFIYLRTSDSADLTNLISIKYSNGSDVLKIDNAHYAILNGSTVNIKLTGSNAEQSLVFYAKNNPSNFYNVALEDQYSTQTLTLTKKVTADSIKFYADENLENEVDSNFYLNEQAQTNLYLKIYHPNNSVLEPSTIKLNSSNNKIKFVGASEDGTLTLTNSMKLQEADEPSSDLHYTLFKVVVYSTDGIQTSTITANAVDMENGSLLGVTASVLAKSVYLVTDPNSFTISPVNNSDANVLTDVDTTLPSFAIINGRWIDFEVSGLIATGLKSANAVSRIAVDKNTEFNNDENGINSNCVDLTAPISNNEFSVRGSRVGGRANNTAVLRVTVYYYASENNVILERSVPIDINIAVYENISTINLSTLTNNPITFINEDYDNARTTSFDFGTNFEPTKKIVLANSTGEVKTKENVSQLKVEFNEDDNLEVYLRYNSFDYELENGAVLNSSDLAIDGLNTDILSGTIIVKLKGKPSRNSITITLTARQFKNDVIGTASSVTVNFVDFEPVDRIVLEGDEIVRKANNSNYVYLSFKDIKEDEADSLSFVARAEYASSNSNLKRFSDLTYLIYEVITDESGNPVSVNNTPLEDGNAKKFSVSFDENNIVTISAVKGENLGGLFKLVVASLDSKIADNNYGKTASLYVQISDGTRQNRYLIENQQDLEAIGKDAVNLSSHYLLANDISLDEDFEPIGKTTTSGVDTVIPFTGSIIGASSYLDEDNNINSTARPKITYALNSYAEVNEGSNIGYYAGLFARIEQPNSPDGATYNNLFGFDVQVNFNLAEDAGIVTGRNLYVGALAGVNKGKISDVGVTAGGIISNSKTNLYFGLIAGQNGGDINLTRLVGVNEKGAVITFTLQNTCYVGGIAGQNEGEISGNYAGKNNLNDYSAFINFNIISRAKTVNVGGIAGETTGNISNLVVGGKITANEVQNIAGIVGVISDAEISNCVVMAMDIEADGTVAGIANESTNSTITNVRFISAKMEYNGLETFGTLKASKTAGIVANSDSSTTVEYGAVESFITTITKGEVEQNFFTFEADEVAGLTFGNAVIQNSFVSADINAVKKVYTTVENSNSQNKNLYFIGEVYGTDTANIKTNDAENSYTAIVSNNKLYTSHNGEDLAEYDSSVYSAVEIFDEFSLNEVVSASGQLIPYTPDPREEGDFENNYYFDAAYLLTEDASMANGYIIKDLWPDVIADYYIKSGDSYQPAGRDDCDNSLTYYKLKSGLDFNSLYYYDNSSNSYVLAGSGDVDVNKEYFSLQSGAFDASAWENEVKSWINESWANVGGSWVSENFKLDAHTNILNLEGNAYCFPYLLQNGSPLMIVRPQDIQAKFNDEFKLSINAVIAQGINLEDYANAQTLIVDFFAREDNVNTLDVNTHQLINTASSGQKANGLVDLQVIPADAQKDVRCEIVSGGRYAYILNNQYIVFERASLTEPIIVKFTSLFDENVFEHVVFFTQYGISKLVLENSDIVSTNDGYELTLISGQGSKNVTIGAENIFEGNNYLTVLEEANVRNYLILETTSEGEAVIVNGDLNSGLTVSINEANSTADAQEISVELKLNLTTYFGESVFPKIDGEDNIISLGGAKLNVKVMRSAESIKNLGANSYIYNTSNRISFDVELKTGYVSDETNPTYDIQRDEGDGNTYALYELNKDSIIISIKETQNKALQYLREANGSTNINLFDFTINCTPQVEDEHVVGYVYSISFVLQDEFSYRYIPAELGNIEFELQISAKSNQSISTSVGITLEPTPLTSARIDNYSAQTRSAGTSYSDIISSSTQTSSIISPTDNGGVMIIHLEPSYANVVSAVLTSSTINPPSLGSDVYIIYEQLVYNARSGAYETIYPANENVSDGHGIILQKVTGKDASGSSYYNGIIYVHTRLSERFSAYTNTITTTLTVNTTDDTITTQKHLLTQYLPGVSLSYEGKQLDDGGYIIQKDTFNNTVSLRVDGYQYNSSPRNSFTWYLKDNSTYKYVENGNINLRDITDLTNFENYRDDINNIYYLNGTEYVQVFKNKIDTYYQFNYALTKLEDELTGKTTFIIDPYTIKDEEKNTYQASDYADVRLDYSSIQQVGESYFMQMRLHVNPDIPTSIRLNSSLTLTSANQEFESENNSLIFHPVDYVVNSVSINEVANNELRVPIRRNNQLNFRFGTDNVNRDLSSEVYAKILEDLGETDFLKAFTFVENGTIINFSETEKLTAFNLRFINNKLVLVGNAEFNNTIQLNLNYRYEYVDGKYEIEFGNQFNSTGFAIPQYGFNLSIYTSTTEEHAEPVTTADEFINMQENGNYILINDITLENFSPITANIASLDGNNKVITIKNFDVNTTRTRYGLFETLGENAILKNVIVNYGECDEVLALSGTDLNQFVFGGLTAENNGLIYNCDIMNLSTRAHNISILLDNSISENITFGGLVGTNNGIITNSRVGTAGYVKIYATDTSETEVYVNASALSFTLGGSNEALNGFVGIAGGFVGVNNGTISNSYFANTSLINYSTAVKQSKTAGFVAQNASQAKITFSYVKAMENTITATNPYSTGARIETATNGNVAGFAYENMGNINNAFANTELITDSAFTAGFVYNNSGTISEAYASCTINKTAGKDVSEQPFIGIDEGQNYLQTGTLTNTYYLENNTNNIVETDDLNTPLGLSQDAFANSENLTGFVFVLSNSRTERQQGVWSYYTADNQLRLLPELVGANQIAYSYRYQTESGAEAGEEDEFVYKNAPSYEQGSVNNPYIIRDYEEFNNVMTSSSTNNSKSGYIRFINNIDFSSSSTNEDVISTRKNFVLGDANNNAITSVEGNGMTISGIYLNASDQQSEAIGLFANIKNAYIKNLTLQFATITSTDGMFSSVRVPYSGGLAGIIDSSVIINIKLQQNVNGTTIAGYNFAGGLAGLVSGNSLIYGIDSNLSVMAVQSASNNAHNYYNENDYNTLRNAGVLNYAVRNYQEYLNTLSFAGGVAGVIDITPQGSRVGQSNLSFVNIYGEQMQIRSMGNILADYAGGIAGYASSGTRALKLKYFTGSNDKIRGRYAVGGLFGIGNGSIDASQVTAQEGEIATANSGGSGQYLFDTAFGNYIINLEKDETSEYQRDADASYGNLNLLSGSNYVGGLVGVGMGTTISNSYSKAAVENGKVIGGLIGYAISTTVNYAYAVPFVNTNNLTAEAKVGGAFGMARSIISGHAETEFENYAKYCLNKLNTDNDYNEVNFMFSTLVVDNNAVDAELDYFCPDHASIAEHIATNGNTSGLTRVFVGESNYKLGVVENGNSARLTTVKLAQLYDTSSANAEQQTIFSQIFSGWSEEYWTLNSARYFPILISDRILDEETISSADEFSKLLSNPAGNYVITKSFDMGDQCKNNKTNWILNVEFTGSLRGQVEGSNATPIISGLFINAQTSGTSGFFRSTNGARISNIEFVWNGNYNESGAIQVNNTISTIGLVSADDQNSLFSNLTVRACSGNLDVNNNTFEDNGAGYNFVSTNRGTISGFGGIVGNAVNSNVVSCSFAGIVSAKVSGTEANIGGLVGFAQQNETDSELNQTSMSVSLSTIGIMDNTSSPTEFNLEVNSSVNLNFGGAVGKAVEASISGTSVGNYINTVKTSLNLKNVTSNIYAGGLVGQSSTKTAISNNAVCADMWAYGNSDAGTTSALIAIGGLAGNYQTGTDYTDIKANSTYAKIYVGKQEEGGNVLGADLSRVYLSTGVAEIDAVDKDVNMEQCLFTGDVTVLEDANVKVSTLYVGGALAKSGGQTVKISETMSTANLFVGTSKTNKLYAGGLVGETDGDIEIRDSQTAGRIVPVCAEFNDDTLIFIAGVAGKAGNVTAENVISTTSIISDALNPDVYQAGDEKLQISALFGVKNVNAKNVVYSSDIALAPEINEPNKPSGYNFVNVSAGDLYNPEHYNSLNFFENNLWTQTESLPYLTNLRSALQNLDILNLYSNGYNYYSLNPKLLNGNEELQAGEADEFAIYIVSSDITLNLTGELNGLLVGSGSGEYVYNSNSAVISEINRHSALSNIHLRLAGEYDFALDSSFIVNTNNGVIFNCSVNNSETGSVSSLKASADFGMICSVNYGLISHCFNSAEVLKVQTNTLAGIVNQNHGTIYSSFFTGYIDNGNVQTAGIVNISAETNYVANCYSAGVIENISTSGNSFVANTDNFNGRNNFIDKFANIEDNNPDLTVNSDLTTYYKIEVVESERLFQAKDLFGNWNTTLKTKSIGDKDKLYIDMHSSTYGYNYLYPTFNFNRRLDNNMESCNNTSNLLYTGTGINKNSVGDEDISTYQNQDFKIDLSNVEEANVKNAFKIPHLGVLKIVQYLANNYSYENNPVHTNLNYEFIYDIDATDGESGMEWKGIGTGDGSQFNGFVFSNKNYTYNPDNYNNLTNNLEGLVEIKGLSTSGIFDNINKAYFTYLRLGSMYALENSGALGANVISENRSTGTAQRETVVTVSNVFFSSTTVITGIDGSTSISALFGNVDIGNNGVLDISNVVTTNGGEPVKFRTAQNAGLIAGELTSGIISLAEAKQTTAQNSNQLYVRFSSEIKYGGGLVGKITSGTIEGKNNTIYIYTEDGSSANIGGVVGMANSAKISNVKVSLPSGTTASTWLSAQSLGGIINTAQSGSVTIENCEIGVYENDNKTVQILSEGSNENYFGLIGAQLVGATINVDGLTLKSSAESNFNVNFTASNGNETRQGFGALLGRQENGTLTLQNGSIDIEITTNGYNLGGWVGLYEGGDIELNKSPIVTLMGVKNVGGVFGSANTIEGIDSTEGSSERTSTTFNTIEMLTSEESFAVITTSSTFNYTDVNFANWGGLFGIYKGNSLKDLTNKNKIEIGTVKNEQARNSIALYNVGGIAGKVENSEMAIIDNLKNSGSIEFKSVTSNSGTIANVNDTIQMSNGDLRDFYALKAINVGGIFGYIQNANINNVKNEQAVIGYQNVGGLIGYLENSSLTDCVITNAGQDSETKSLRIFTQKPDPTDTETWFKNEGTAKNPLYVPTTTKGEDYTYTLNELPHVTSNISGVLNVGGAVGTLIGGSSIEGIYSTAKVNGNVNVGGLVGAIPSTGTASVLNNVVKGSTINGIFYKEIIVKTSEETEEDFDYGTNYFPTSIGGFIGNAQSDNSVIRNNFVSNIEITSAQEGMHTANTDSSRVISTVSNPMVNVRDTNNDIYSKDKVYNMPSTNLMFNNISSGVGGFIGTTNTSAIEAGGESSDGIAKNIATNYMGDVSIKAELGINVGSFYGYLRTSGSKNTINIPTLMADVAVSGAYNIGGIVGNYTTANKWDEGYNLSQVNVFENSKPTIHIMSNKSAETDGYTDSGITGMYVGGLFGKLKLGNNGDLSVSNLVLEKKNNVQLDLNFANNYYIGGLIGRLEGNLDGIVKDESGDEMKNSDGSYQYNTSVDDSVFVKSNEKITDEKYVANFGGLVGLLKVATKSGGTTATVTGEHNFAFTINTIENSNYYDGPTTYDYNDDDATNLYLVAQAYYVNEDNFNISGSSNTSLYDGEKDVNPLLQGTKAWGWHKTYTGFKTLQRYIPAGTGEGTSGTQEWDAIQQIYDASNITHVGTIANLNLTGQRLYIGKDGSEYRWSTSHFAQDYLCFTIYEDTEGNPKLYSRIGVGTVYKDEESNFATPKDEVLNWFEKYAMQKTGENYYIDLNNPENKTQGLTYLVWKTGESTGEIENWTDPDLHQEEGSPKDFCNITCYTTIGGHHVNMTSDRTSSKYLTYKVNTSFYNDLANEETQGGIYFVFDIIYSNSSTIYGDNALYKS